MTSPGGIRRRVVVALVVLLLFAATVLVNRLLADSGDDATSVAPVPLASSEAAPLPRTVLLQALDGQGVAVGNVLLAGPGEQTPAVMLRLPSGLLVPTPEPVPLWRTPDLADTLAARHGLEALLGVRVDVSMELGRLALVGLVDAVGGVPVELDRPMQVLDDKGQVERVVPSGWQRLDGVAAAEYALALSPGEPESQRVQHFTTVIDRVLWGLPEDRETMGQLVLSLGSLAQSTATNDELVSALLALRAGLSNLQVIDVPAVEVRAGQASVLAGPEASTLVARVLPDALIAPSSLPRPVVGIWSAGASAGQLAVAMRRLMDAGFTPIARGTVPVQRTAVLVTGGTALIERGMQVAEVLDVGPLAVSERRDSAPASGIEVRLGADARP